MYLFFVPAIINWFNLREYSHFGQPGGYKYPGPPLLFVLLNFLIFAFIVFKFVIPLIKKQLKLRHDNFSEKSERLDSEYKKLKTELAEVDERLSNIDEELNKMREMIEINLKKTENNIMNMTHQYIRSRHKETENQITIKRFRMSKKIREAVLSRVVKRSYVKVKTELNSELQTNLLKNTVKALERKRNHG